MTTNCHTEQASGVPHRPHGPIRAGRVALVFLLLPLSSADWTARDRDDRPGALERRNQDLIRSSGFQDVELDRIHADLARQLKALAAEALPEVEGNNAEAKPAPSAPGDQPQPVPASTSEHPAFRSVTGETIPALIPSREHSFVKGIDKDGRVYYRLRLKEGLNFTTDPRPDRFIFRAHAYLYLNQAGTGLEKIILQFYRVRARLAYVREIRRIIHPGPFGPAASNGVIQLEFRQYPEEFPRADLTVDGIPRPVLTGEPQLRTVLHSPDDPMSFDKQSRVLETYRSLLRKLERQMARELELRRLNRNAAIERAMDFTGTSF